MILKETFYIGDYPMVRYYSDRQYRIRCIETEEEYSEAIDTIGSAFTYEEIIECYNEQAERKMMEEGQRFLNGYKVPSSIYD